MASGDSGVQIPSREEVSQCERYLSESNEISERIDRLQSIVSKVQRDIDNAENNLIALRLEAANKPDNRRFSQRINQEIARRDAAQAKVRTLEAAVRSELIRRDQVVRDFEAGQCVRILRGRRPLM